MKARIFPVSMMWVEWKPDRNIPVIRNSALDVIEPFLDYILHVAHARHDAQATESAFKSSMEHVGYGLLALARYLASERSLSWQQLTNETLVAFRNSMKEAIRKNPKSRHEESAKRTSNARVRVIYEFLTWAQEDALLISGIVGNTGAFPVRSSLPQLRISGHRNLRTDLSKYPKLFSNVGASSRTSDRQYWATDNDFEEIRQHFWSTSGHATAARNDLLLRLFNGLGWRRASVNSLTVDQFSDTLIDEAINNDETHIAVSPPEQKFGYKRAFFVPISLALAVKRYIKEDRHLLLQSLGVDEENFARHDGRIFLSVSTAQPLTHGAVSGIFRDAFRTIGGDVGANTHSFRRKFAESRWAEEIEFRQREGLSLAYEDIAIAVADDLGHASIVSQDAYHRILSRIRKLSVEQLLRNRVEDLSDRVAAQMSVIAKLRDSVAQCVAAAGKFGISIDDSPYDCARALLADLEDV